MSDKKISELPVASSINNSDAIPIVQGGVNKQITAQNLLAGAGGGTPIQTNDSDTLITYDGFNVKTDPNLFWDGQQLYFTLIDDWGGMHVLGKNGGEASISLHPDNITNGSQGQWIVATNGSNMANSNDFGIYNAPRGMAVTIQQSTSNVGINQANPQAKLHVSGGPVQVGDPGNDQSVVFGGTNAGLIWGAPGGASLLYNNGNLLFSSVASQNAMMLQATTGQVGVGTQNPQALLDVNGTFHAGNDATFDTVVNTPQVHGPNGLDVNCGNGNIGLTPGNGQVQIHQPSPTLPFAQTSYGLSVISGGNISTTLGADATNSYLQSWNNGPLMLNYMGNDVQILPQGFGNVLIGQTGAVKVGICTPGTPTEKLEVNGNVKATAFIGDGSQLTNLPVSGGLLQNTVTLQAADLASLHIFPGYTIVPATGLTATQAIIVYSVEFYYTFSSSPYTTTANLFLNYGGNWPGGQTFPAGRTTNNANIGLLTETSPIYRFVQNSANDQNVPTQMPVLLNADGTITGGGGQLKVRTTYKIVDLASF